MNRKTKIIIFSSVVSLVILAIILNFVSKEFYSFSSGNPIKRVYFKNFTVRAEIVSSDEKRALGLAGRSGLAQDAGMLFLMPSDRIPQFWMQGMQFPIDIIWIKMDRIIGCERNIQPTDTRIFTSPGFSSLVLEVNKGFCDQYDVEVNDQIKVQ